MYFILTHFFVRFQWLRSLFRYSISQADALIFISTSHVCAIAFVLNCRSTVWALKCALSVWIIVWMCQKWPVSCILAYDQAFVYLVVENCQRVECHCRWILKPSITASKSFDLKRKRTIFIYKSHFYSIYFTQWNSFMSLVF